MSRDNICKTQCSFVLNALDPEGGGQQRPHQNFFIESDTLQAPGFFDDTAVEPLDDVIGSFEAADLASNPTVIPQLNANGRPFRAPTSALGGLGRPGGPPIAPAIPLAPPSPPRAPRPPNSPPLAPSGATGIVPPQPPPPAINGATNANAQIPQANPTRQPRPIFTFIPRLPNFTELFGI